MKRILVPVDFSEHSEYALEVAAHLAGRNQAEILVLHMLGLSEAFLTKDETQEVAEAHYYMKLAKKRFEQFLNKPYLKGIRIMQMVQNYKIFSEINDVAEENDVDLIVMGSHGTGGISELFVGSNTEKVVRTSEVPVLVVKVKRPRYTPKSVLFATDFNLESVHAYNRIRNIIANWGAEIHLVHVNLPNEMFRSSSEKQKSARLFMEAAHGKEIPDGIEVHFVSDYSIETGIYYLAEQIGADMIALTTHGRSGLVHFFKGSIGEDLANHAKMPVLTCKV